MASKKEVHPLFNPVILEKIFSKLQIQSLKNCRLVCKAWNKSSLPHLQKNSWVKLIRGGKADHDQFSFRTFMELVDALHLEKKCIPFENYYLDHWAVNEKREKSLKAFWNICGPSMRQLHFANVIFYEVETIRNIMYVWSPKLESLKLEECLFYTITNENCFHEKIGEGALQTEDFDEPNLSYDYYDHVTVAQLKNIERIPELPNVNNNLTEFTFEQLEDEEFPLAWEEIFHAFPNLAKFNISLMTKTEQISRILESLTVVRQESNFLGNISELTFYQNDKPNFYLADSHLYQVANIVCLPLTSLNLVLPSSIKLESIENLVRQYSPVLKNLCLHAVEESENQPLELFTHQKFPCLNKLCICVCMLGGNFDFINKMPHLKRLHVWSKEEEFNWETQLDSVICKSLALKNSSYTDMRELSIGYGVQTVQAIDLLSSWFRNLRVLMMPLTDEVIRVVFRELINLEEITVFERHLTDVGITGNPVLLSESTAWDSESPREFPYIGSLKKLWKFTLTFRRYEGITDMSVYHGFMEVPQLSSLLLTRTKIGDKALQDLSAKSTIITMVTPTVCKGVDSEYS